MSALWTPGRAGVNPRGSWWHSPAPSRCGTTATAASDPASSAAPSPATRGPSHVTNVMTLNIELYLAPARRPGGHGSTPAPPRTEPALPCSCPESVYSTRVGIHWPRVVRTARGPHLPEVPPTLVQWPPTLVQCIQTTPAATTVTGAAPLRQGEQQLSRLGNPPHRRLEMPRRPKLPEAMRQHRGLRVRTRALRYEREALAQGRARRPWFNAQFRARTPPPVPSRPMCTKAGLSWSRVVRTARSPGKPSNQGLGCHAATQRRPPSRSYLMPRVRGVKGTKARSKVRTRGACSRAGPEAMVQRPVPGPDPSSRSESTNVHEGGAELVRRGACGGPRSGHGRRPSDRPTCRRTAQQLTPHRWLPGTPLVPR